VNIDSARAGGDAPGEQPSQQTQTFDTVRVEWLREGMRLSRDIFDQDGVLLLAAKNQITPRFLELLSQRSIVSVKLKSQPRRSPDAILQTLDQSLTAALRTNIFTRCKPAVRNRSLSPAAMRSAAQQGLTLHATAVTLVRDVGAQLALGQESSCDRVVTAVSDMARLLTLDCDLLPLIVGLQRTDGEEHLYDHAVDCAMLSMIVAAQLGFSSRQITEIGIGAMLQNVGMLRVPVAIRRAARALEHHEMERIRRHPVDTLEMLESLQGVPTAAKIIAYQSHEREDGSGYPRGRRSTEIHPFAKIVAITDTYSAMVRPRPYRAAIQPHRAMHQLLVDGGAGKFDRTILRAILDCLSVFPIGSFVMLKKRVIGQVIRANPGAHTRPVLVEVDDAGEPTAWEIDLLKHQRVEIIATGSSMSSLLAEESQTAPAG